MSGSGSLRYFAILAALVCVLAASWLALAHFFPAPPSKITMATASVDNELLGNKYKALLARFGVDVSVLRTNGAIENLLLLQKKILALKSPWLPVVYRTLRCRLISVPWVE